MRCHASLILTPIFLAAASAWAQKTTNVNLNLSFNPDTRVSTFNLKAIGNAALPPLGAVAIRLDITQPSADDDNSKPTGDFKGTLSFVFNRLDSFDVSLTGPGANFNVPPVTGNITAGRGAYSGATGSMNFTYSSTNNQSLNLRTTGVFLISATGSVTVSGKTTAITLSNVRVWGHDPAFGQDFKSSSGTGTGTPGNVTISGSSWSSDVRELDTGTLAFNANDSVFILFGLLNSNGLPPPFPVAVTGGTGAYAGATGTSTATVTGVSSSGASVNVTGTITVGATVPTITEVATAYGRPEIAQNTWITIKGKNLVPSDTPAAGVIWSDAPEFNSGKMPTQLKGISVTVNGRSAYVYFFCSAATNPSCASDQINVLTPLDNTLTGVPAAVIVTNGSVASPPFAVSTPPYLLGFGQQNADAFEMEPSFLLFNAKGYVAATHANYSLIGPSSLYPGSSTPAKAGETVLLFTTGFGLPATTLVAGSATQAGPLPPNSVWCYIGPTQAAVAAANLISPGLYQLNVVVPNGTPSGDNLIWCGSLRPFPGGGSYLGPATPAGNLITVQ